MKLSDFFMLDDVDKKSAILHKGVLIARRKEIDSTVFLFDLGGYYVETYCNPENEEIEEYRVFGNTKCLTPYLASIHIDTLFE